MKKVLLILVAFISTVLIGFAPTALAADVASGAKVFETNCAACHLGGKNLVNPSKTLQKADLEANEMASIEAIQNQIRNGKNAMPAFSGRLSEAQIEDVAAYVLSQAETGW